MTRINKKEAKELGIKLPEEENQSQLKYKNKITEVNGIKFRSKKEAEFYKDLLWRKEAEEIKDFELQPKFWLLDPEDDEVTGNGIYYRADFKVIYPDGSVEIIDTKGYRTQVYKLKKKLLLARYPDIDFREV